MLKSELLEIIASKESSGVEFKRDDVRPEQVAKEIVAMANLKGGRLLMGVEDDGTISGIQRADLEEWLMNIFSSKVHPMILPFYEEVMMDDGKRVAIATFAEGTSKPYVLRHEGREEIYIRVGTTSRRATREQQARLHQVGGMLHAELLPVSGAGLAALDRRRMGGYLQHIMRDAILPQSDEEWCRRLVSLGLMSDAAGSTCLCSIAGILLFGQTPRRYLRQAGIRLMIFDGRERSYEARYDKVIDGPILASWEDPGSGSRTVAKDGLFDTVDDVLGPFIAKPGKDVEGGLRRDVGPRFPREAIREVLVNAVAHRDWTRLNDVEVVVYSDRIEVVSPGPLPNTMTVEKMIAGQRSPRNPILVDALRDYGYADARGMGIRNKVIPLVRAMAGTDPVFEETDDYMRIVLPGAQGE